MDIIKGGIQVFVVTNGGGKRRQWRRQLNLIEFITVY